jgi:hypothetical protein
MQSRQSPGLGGKKRGEKPRDRVPPRAPVNAAEVPSTSKGARPPEFKADGDTEVTYRLSREALAKRPQLEEALRSQGIEFYWDGYLLVVDKVAESAVDSTIRVHVPSDDLRTVQDSGVYVHSPLAITSGALGAGSTVAALLSLALAGRALGGAWPGFVTPLAVLLRVGWAHENMEQAARLSVAVTCALAAGLGVAALVTSLVSRSQVEVEIGAPIQEAIRRGLVRQSASLSFMRAGFLLGGIQLVLLVLSAVAVLTD